MGGMNTPSSLYCAVNVPSNQGRWWLIISTRIRTVHQEQSFVSQETQLESVLVLRPDTSHQVMAISPFNSSRHSGSQRPQVRGIHQSSALVWWMPCLSITSRTGVAWLIWERSKNWRRIIHLLSYSSVDINAD